MSIVRMFIPIPFVVEEFSISKTSHIFWKRLFFFQFIFIHGRWVILVEQIFSFQIAECRMIQRLCIYPGPRSTKSAK